MKIAIDIVIKARTMDYDGRDILTRYKMEKVGKSLDFIYFWVGQEAGNGSSR